MSDDESQVLKKLEELSQQVKSLRRLVIGLAVFFITLVCFLVGPTPDGEAILFAVIAVGIYYVIVVLGDRLSYAKVTSNDPTNRVTE